jgi:EAL domain-containing protein (putative c-di-GMP-specific phosphodiesterase class I)
MRTPSAFTTAPETGGDLDQVLDARAVRAVFQPLIDLDSGDVLGYEALARGPAGSPLESPGALVPAAYASGRVAELDWACRAAAFGAACRAELHPSLSLFVNCEPVSLGVACPDDLRPLVEAAERQLHVVMEVTERAVARDPAGLLGAVARARAVGWGVALDDVGAEPASLAVMPFVRPDVIKLDLRLVQGRTTAEVARIVNAVRAQAERTGARILAEGIETRRHAEIARSLGATIGQGYLYGRPGMLPTVTRAPRGQVLLLRNDFVVETRTPFEVVTASRATERAPKDLLRPMSMHIEHKGLDAAEPSVLLACFQEARHFTSATRDRFGLLASRAALTGALGVGMPVTPMAGVRGAALGPDDPLRGEWDVVMVGPHFAAALVARDCGDDGPDARPPLRLRHHPRPRAGHPGPPNRCWTSWPRRADGQEASTRGPGWEGARSVVALVPAFPP